MKKKITKKTIIKQKVTRTVKIEEDSAGLQTLTANFKYASKNVHESAIFSDRKLLYPREVILTFPTLLFLQ